MDIQQILIKYWGYSKFRPLQEEIITSVLNGVDTLALMPTAGGKSICFQVPVLGKEGIGIVVSPLIALMKDQVHQLQKRGIRATAIYAGMSKREIDITLDNCAYGNYKFLYLSPERLSSEIVRERIQKMNITLLAVDEAHCISQWGYDFRPSYLEIAEIRELIPEVVILALTATATSKVKEDIQEKLLFKDGQVMTQSFERKNLSYVTFYEEGKINKMIDIISKVKGSGIIYVRSRKRTSEIAQHLIKKGFSADYYHAGLETQLRSKKQNDWLSNKTRFIVCTNAFGMGIDKPDVRTVIHLEPPDSLEAYFQEAGRAGRDGKKAYSVLLFNVSDKLELSKRLKESYPDIIQITHTYQGLANYFQLAVGAGEGESFDFNINQFTKAYNLTYLVVKNSLKILEQDNWIATSEAVFIPSKVMMKVGKQELYKFEVANKRFEPLIKLLLRTCAGIFDEFVRINENDLAKQLDSDENEIRTFLKGMKKMEVLYYEEQKDLPQLTFVRPRADIDNLSINKQFLNRRKKIQKDKVDAVLKYLSNTMVCRGQVLLAYFDEKDSNRCGVCDICLERNKLELSDLEYSAVVDQINASLSTKPMYLNDLVRRVKDFREDKVLKAIHWLKDSGQLKENSENKLEKAE